jgi:hypothetical protein
MIDPQHHTVVLPADTVPLTATNITVMMTAGGDGKMIPRAILDTREMGAYNIGFTGSVFTSLVQQVLYFNSLDDDQLQAVAQQLNNNEGEA